MKLDKNLNLILGEYKKECREGFGDALVEIGSNQKVVALTADLSPSVKMDDFKSKYPKRFFDVGVAEQNLVTVASGLAHVGKIPFVSAFGAFCPGRCWEQIRTAISYNNENVNIVASHCGISVGPDGATHQILEDIAMMRTIPNMVVISPCDYEQAKKATKAMLNQKTPCYMRYGRGKVAQLTTPKTPFEIGKAQLFQHGSDVCIITTGATIYDALVASEQVKYSVRIINLHTIKPIDEQIIIQAAKECGKIITVEDHQVAGGMGSAVAEIVSEKYPCTVVRLGVQNSFGESGSSEELFSKFGIDTKSIASEIEKICK